MLLVINALCARSHFSCRRHYRGHKWRHMGYISVVRCAHKEACRCCDRHSARLQKAKASPTAYGREILLVVISSTFAALRGEEDATIAPSVTQQQKAAAILPHNSPVTPWTNDLSPLESVTEHEGRHGGTPQMGRMQLPHRIKQPSTILRRIAGPRTEMCTTPTFVPRERALVRGCARSRGSGKTGASIHNCPMSLST